MSWEKLHKIYRKKGIVLALGAGVSVRSGLPDWGELLQRIGSVCLGQEGRRLVSDLIDQRFSLPAIAGILRENCPAGKNFWDIVRAQLYLNFPFFPEGVSKTNPEGLIKHIGEENQTLRAVAGLCAVRDKKHSQQEVYVRNPQVKAIINFNIDAVLRRYIGVRYPRADTDKGKAIVRTVERASKSSKAKRINIYHMHGYLRFDMKANKADREAYDKLVFAEQEYFDFFNSPTSLFNYTFLYLLREHSCVFIGLSMKDDNIRRLLHYLRKERVQAYEEEKDKGPDKIESRVLRHFAILERSQSEATDRLIEQSLRYLGTIVLWIDKYERIPELLGKMYESGGDDWSTVY